MKHKLHIFFAVLFVQLTVSAQLPGYKWAKAIGTSSTDPNSWSTGRDIVADTHGNVYVVGGFWGTLDFDPGSGIQLQTSNGLQDVFLAKTDSSGNLLWIKCFGGSGYDVGNSIALDSNGDVYIAGGFSMTVDLDPGAATETKTSLAKKDCFISKFNAAGNFIWTKCFEGAGDDEILSLSLDATGNIGVAGQFDGNVDFDPGPAVATYTCYGGIDGFAAKLNPSGSFLWARSYGAWNTLTGYETARDLVFDHSGNLFVIGDFQYNVDFDPGPAYVPMIAGCSIASFLVKLNVNGDLVWVKGFGGHIGAYGNSVGIDNNHNIIVAGTMGVDDPSGDFDPGFGTYSLTSNGIQDAYVAKIDSAGNFLWARNFGGSGMDFARNLTIDRNNNIITTGEFFSTADFDPSTAVVTMTPVGSGDVFISVLTAAGSYLWAGQLKGYSSAYLENGNAVYADSNGALYATGLASTGTDFDPSAATATINGFSMSAYALKFRDVCVVPSAPLDVNGPGKKNVCKNNVASLSVSSANPVKWYSSSSSTLSIGSGTIITVNTSTSGVFVYYAASETCTSSARTSITVTVSACTGLSDDNVTDAIHMAPNPASDELHIQASTNEIKIKISIYDLSGKFIKQVDLKGSGSLNITDLSPGMYIVKGAIEGKVLHQRLIVSR